MKKNLLFKENENLNKYHTYGINAKARFLIEIFTIKDLQIAIEYAKTQKIPFVFIGRGSNVLFKDDYFHGLVIINKMKKIVINKTVVTAQSGVSLPLLAKKTTKLGLSGLEFLIGIPGTLGGGIFMNAGVLGLEVSNQLISVKVLYPDGNIKTINQKDCDFSYRSSSFHYSGGIILEAVFCLKKDEKAYLTLEKHLEKRITTQPVKMKNSGCIFKNPDSKISAGKLIDSCNLKGLTVGGAQVCYKHGNFINNINNATFKDIMELISKVKKIVKKQTSVELKYEVRII